MRNKLEENEKKILINVEDDETRIAVVDNSTLDNLYIEQTHRTQILGNIYFGKVVKVQPSFQAAFVNYGAERHVFLAISGCMMMFDREREVYVVTTVLFARSSPLFLS